MSWVRNNTNEKDVFLHWWDYGYWVQTGGERPTFSDGGHAAQSFGDHLVARYVLTTPYPETAKSFMKTNNISYFLLDPTDVGKYSAYSSIADDEEISDRASWLPTFVSDPESIQETRNETIRIYQGGTYIDSDLVYEKDGEKIFLPKGKAAIGAVILSKTPNTYSQPTGVYVYNNKRYDLPMRYLFVNGKLFDFKRGINATAYIYPSVDKTNLQFDLDGAAMYLSEKTMNSLFVQVYLMDDPNNLYPELELVHSQGNYPFPFYYGSFQGQIKIYEVHKEEMENILSKDEFLKRNGTYGEFDDLVFVK